MLQKKHSTAQALYDCKPLVLVGVGLSSYGTELDLVLRCTDRVCSSTMSLQDWPSRLRRLDQSHVMIEIEIRFRLPQDFHLQRRGCQGASVERPCRDKNPQIVLWWDITLTPLGSTSTRVTPKSLIRRRAGGLKKNLGHVNREQKEMKPIQQGQTATTTTTAVKTDRAIEDSRRLDRASEESRRLDRASEESRRPDRDKTWTQGRA
ncbi:hypothetical protein ElyMa_005624600 [Elysia marginata]|uniref:Uncharacterized protein n=1 Tax=Elysia marginata TaxID=1093978 RepID=A0AAV4F8N2_9GAST|nr:hypothetical protein ElyMa_005624600 [Elysia marginata]